MDECGATGGIPVALSDIQRDGYGRKKETVSRILNDDWKVWLEGGRTMRRLRDAFRLLGQRPYRWLLIGLMALCIGANSETLGAHPVVKLKLWTHQRHMADLTKRLIKEFNATVGKKKRISVSVTVLGDDASRIFQEAQLKMEGPDLYSTNFNSGFADPFQAGAKIWFDDLPGFQQWKKSWPSWYWIEGITTYQGHVFAIPVEVINSRLIYNRDLFRRAGLDPDKPPLSYEELKQIARKITKAGGGNAYGFAYCGAESWPLEWMPSQWAEANGDPAYWDWKTGRWAIQGYYKVFQLLLDLQNEGSLFPGTAFLTNDALRAQFAEGRIGMFMGEAWDVGVLNEQYPAKCDWGVAPIPTYDGRFHGKPRAMIIGGYWSINGQSRYKLQAWEVVKWFSRYEIRAKFYEHGKCIDPDPKVTQVYAKQKSPLKGFKEFAETLDKDYLASYPVLPGWKIPERNPCTVFRDILLNGGSLADRLQQLETEWNQELDRFYRNNPSVKREWNIYPQFDRISGQLGKPLAVPVFDK